MREIRLYGSEGGGTELNRSSLPLSTAEHGSVSQRPARRRSHQTKKRPFGGTGVPPVVNSAPIG